jgi:hypothetical protein
MNITDLKGMTVGPLVKGDLYDFWIIVDGFGKRHHVERRSIEIAYSEKEYRFIRKLGLACALLGKDRTVKRVYSSSSDADRFKRINYLNPSDKLLDVGIRP